MAADKVKAASKDAMEAFKMFASNPVAGLSESFHALGEARALGVGMTFGAIFAICLIISAYRILPWGGPQGFTGFLKFALVSVVPFLSLFGVSFLGRKALHGDGGLAADSFISGAVLLPLAFVSLLAGILGTRNYEVILIFMFFAVSLMILMLFAGLTRINKVSERVATLAVPLMSIVTAWLSKIIYAALL